MDEQKIVLITGCAEGGAGAALAREFRRRGHRVFATTRGGVEKLGFLSAIGVEPVQLDVTCPASVSAAASHVKEATGGRLDILINNAAVFSQMPLADVRLQDARDTFETNVFGVLAVTQAFLPLLAQSANAQEEGREGRESFHDITRKEKEKEKKKKRKGSPSLVVNVSSLSAIMCPPFQGVYAASKAALLALSHTMRVELAPLDVRVVAIVSGGVATASAMRSLPLPPAEVPDNSIYKPLAASIEGNEVSKGYKAMPPAEYARQVVDDLLPSSGKSCPKPVLWRGAFAWLAWVLTWFGWIGMMDGSQIRKSGLGGITYVSKDAVRV